MDSIVKLVLVFVHYSVAVIDFDDYVIDTVEPSATASSTLLPNRPTLPKTPSALLDQYFKGSETIKSGNSHSILRTKKDESGARQFQIFKRTYLPPVYQMLENYEVDATPTREQRYLPLDRARVALALLELPIQPTLIIIRQFQIFKRTYLPPVYQMLENYEVDATPTREQRYPWIARVVHSLYQSYPFVCTATCIEPQIFITSASCLNNLKVAYTAVIYEKMHLPARAFVVPSFPTRMQFDDIGFIVVEAGNYNRDWPTVNLLYAPRPEGDDRFQWFADLGYENATTQHKVIGYASKKMISLFKTATTEYRLVELPVVVGIDMCARIFEKGSVKGYRVPCYNSCNFKDFENSSRNCNKYLGTDGAAIYNFKTEKLLGVATWSVYSSKIVVPVGFAVPNSDNFFEDLECAIKLRNDGKEHVSKGYYQSVCANKTRD